jgi:hypothetical protein
MKEIFIDKNDPYFNRPKAFYILVFSVFIFGCLIAYLFIPPEQKIVQVPVEKVKYVDRVVEKKVEVPVEKVKYVDRVVEKVVEKTVEVPVEVEKFVLHESNVDPDFKYKMNWRYLKMGMSRDQVRSILGSPNHMSCNSYTIYWHYGLPPDDRAVAFPLNYDEGVIDWFIRN